MTVCNIESRHRFKETDNFLHFKRVIHYIQGVAYTVFGNKIGNRFLFRHQLQHIGADLRPFFVSQEHRAGLGLCLRNVAHPVLLLFRPGKLVAADDSVPVFFHSSCSHQTNLDVLVHPLPVNIKAGGLILFHLAVFHIFQQILPCFGVHCVAVGIRAFRHGGFRLGNC